MLIDTHAHLNLEEFDKDRTVVITRLKENNIRIIDVGINLATSKKSIGLSANNNGHISATVGLHPHLASELDDKLLGELKRLIINNNEVVAVGEIGLDYYRNRSPKEAQIDALHKLLDIGLKSNKPVIIHCREAYKELISILTLYSNYKLRGVIHCFSGTKQDAMQFIDMGFCISFSGVLTFPNANELRDVARYVPMEHILLETDCPYLAPYPLRGKRNEPSYIIHIANTLCKIKNLSLEDIERIININTYKLFHIGNINLHAKISYKIRDSLYLNITNRCSNNCIFCPRHSGRLVKGHNLVLDKEPSEAEIISSIESQNNYNEVVFCGYGEPTIRLDIIKSIASSLKRKGVKVRLNTNGQGNLIAGRNILPELKGLIDNISISLNAETKERYCYLCRPDSPEKAYNSIMDFIMQSTSYIHEITLTVVNIPEVININKCRDIANNVGANFRIRDPDIVG